MNRFVMFFFALLVSISVANAEPEATAALETTDTIAATDAFDITQARACTYVRPSIEAGKAEPEILNYLISEEGGMTLQEAVDEIIACCGDQQIALSAALLINPDFEYIPSPDIDLAAINCAEATAAGPAQAQQARIASNAPTSSGGGAAVSP